MPDFGRWTSNGGDPSLNEINRTDRFLDALASEQPVYSTDPGEAELAYLLAGWRDELREPPTRAPVTPRDAAVALRRGVASRQRTRWSMAVIGSVAAALLCLGGFGAVVYGAGPGDALYGLRTMLFGEQQATRDYEVFLAAQTELAEVQQLIDQGQWTAAQDKLEAITTTVATVNDDERKQELVDQWQQLSVKVETRDPNATVPPNAPPVTLPEPPPADNPVPVIVEPGTTTSSSETTTTTTTTTSSSPPSTTTTSSAPAEPPPVTTTPPPVTTTPPTTTTTTTPPTTTTTTPPTTTTTPPTTTTTATTTRTTTTTTTTAPTTTTTTTGTSVVGAPVEEGGGSDAVEPPTSTAAPGLRGPEGSATLSIPVTTTTPIIQLPLPDLDGE